MPRPLPCPLAMKAISLRGTVECIGQEKLGLIFERNPYMGEIYPTEVSRQALVVVRMKEGQGELFDLSTKPSTRKGFPVGSGTTPAARYPYLIGIACSSCEPALRYVPRAASGMKGSPSKSSRSTASIAEVSARPALTQ